MTDGYGLKLGRHESEETERTKKNSKIGTKSQVATLLRHKKDTRMQKGKTDASPTVETISRNPSGERYSRE